MGSLTRSYSADRDQWTTAMSISLDSHNKNRMELAYPMIALQKSSFSYLDKSQQYVFGPDQQLTSLGPPPPSTFRQPGKWERPEPSKQQQWPDGPTRCALEVGHKVL